jgi:UDP-glucose 6-dehydrogenase
MSRDVAVMDTSSHGTVCPIVFTAHSIASVVCCQCSSQKVPNFEQNQFPIPVHTVSEFLQIQF